MQSFLALGMLFFFCNLLSEVGKINASENNFDESEIILIGNAAKSYSSSLNGANNDQYPFTNSGEIRSL